MIRRLLVATALLPWGAVWAQDTTAAPPPSTAQEPTWSIPKRRLDLYAGLRSNGGTHAMVGAKFSRQIPSKRNMAAAGYFEVAFADQTEYIVGAMFQYMPLNRLLLETGPGLEFDGGNNAFWRVSGEYELQARKLFIIPKFYVDFIEDGPVFGYGLAIGRH